jgi:hypothetical protein
MRSASALLDVVEAHEELRPDGIYELADVDPLPEIDVFGPGLDPTPTRIDAETLRDALRRTQVIRHAREEAAELLEDRHVNALTELNADAALRVSLEYGEDVDEYGEGVVLADAVERARAPAYLDSLSFDEMERRANVDYAEEYLEVEDGERYHTAHECPVCGLEALIETMRDSYLDEFPAGTCIACSYTKSFDIVDLEGRDEAIQRAVDDPNR